jgi:GT2 family glycosyltransferase
MSTLDVLIPTYRRPAALAVTLTSLTAQTLPRFRVVVSDQTEDEDTTAAGEVQTPVRLLHVRGRSVDLRRYRAVAWTGRAGGHRTGRRGVGTPQAAQPR